MARAPRHSRTLARRGWEALAAGDFKLRRARASIRPRCSRPGKEPDLSRLCHYRLYTYFNDPQFADELFKIALKQPGALANLNADYGHMLLAANRSGDAEPVLEQAVKDTPEAGDAWTDLGLARLRNHNPAGACLAADQADKLSHATHAHTSIRWIWREAKCSGH